MNQEQFSLSGLGNYIMKGAMSLIPDEIVINTRPFKQIIIGEGNPNFSQTVVFRYDKVSNNCYPENICGENRQLLEVVYVIPENFREQYSIENRINIK